MKNKKYYLLIGIYGIILILILLCGNHLYGSTTDWISQHSVLPEYFRNMFYETGRFIPNFAFNLGAGQNIFNYSYYGLLSPVILVSYLLPFINMTTYIQAASIILYILFGILMFKFIDNNINNSKLSFIIGLASLSISSVNYNFHHHIMFVWYLPFLVMSLIGVDRYINKKKSDLLMFSSFLVIMTNYYYSIGSLVAIFLYGVYKILSKNNFKIRESIKESFIFGLHLVVPVLMSMIILIPTLLCIKGASRGHSSITLLSILVPNFKELFYNPIGLGLIGIFISAIICNIFSTKKDKSNLFINIFLLIIFLIPIVAFFLNGFLYVRGKVLIPFIPLYLYSFSLFYKNLDRNKINFKYAFIFLIVVIFISSIFWKFNFIIGIEVLISLIIIYLGVLKNKKVIIWYMFLILFVSLIFCNKSEEYISKDYYKKVTNPGISELYKNIGDKDVYRSYNDLIPKVDINRAYSSNYYSPAIYSSTYNSDYWNFYNFYFGNNMKYRNVLITSGSDNDLFYTFMGVRYITSPNKTSFYYKKIDSKNGINLYYNEDSYPIMYVPSRVGSISKFNSLKFPYNMEYMMINSIIDSDVNDSFTSQIEKVDFLELDESYDFKIKKRTHKKINLDEIFNGKILYISFKMNKNKTCNMGAVDDLYISINGVKNKLTCGGYIYHNLNNFFEYVIPIVDSNNGLDIEFGVGEYNISDIEVYYSDKILGENTAVNNIVIDKKDDTISGDITLNDDNYIITSIPYDKGFSVFINDKEISYEKVNGAFLGFRGNKGENKILIKYTSPGFNVGKYISILGIILFICVVYFEKYNIFRKKKDK